MHILGDDITTVQQTGSHILSITRIALYHLVVWLEARHGDLLDRVGFVRSFGSRNNWCISNEREVDTWVWDQVGLELVEINVEGTIKTKGGSNGRNNLSDQSVQVLVVGALETKVSAADIVDSFVVNHEGTVGVLKGSVGGENGVVWLNDGGCGLGSWVNTELELNFLSEIDRQTLHEESTETRASSTSERVEDQETLETRAVIGDLANLIQDLINQFLANSVMSTGIVVGSVLLSSNHLLGMEQAAVGTSADLIDDIGLEIAVDGSGNIFALTSLGEEGAETLIRVSGLALLSQISIGLNAMLEAVKLPARVGNLATSLADVNANDFSHFEGVDGLD
jgi:hypothetical protein